MVGQEIVEEVHKMDLEDRRLKMREIAEVVVMLFERKNHILIEELGMKKLSARLVSRLLTQDENHFRVEMFEECSVRF